MILYYIYFYSFILFLIFFSKFIKLKEKYIFFVFSLVYLFNAFRGDTINDDSINYHYYFTDVSSYSNFSDLLMSENWIKVEIGFKALLYGLSNINIFSNVFLFKIAISIINLSILGYLFAISKRKYNNFLLFIFFYICFFLFIFDFAILRFSISALLLLLLFHNLIYTKYNNFNIFFIYLLSASFHFAGMIFGIVFFYFYYIIKFNYNFLFIIFPFLLLSISLPLIIHYTEIFGTYYSAMFDNAEEKMSIRIILEGLFLFYIYYKFKNKNYAKVFKLLFILYLFFAFLELSLGILVLNRLRIIVWLFFLYSIVLTWKDINTIFKINLIIYSLIFYFIQLYNIGSNWK
jgi:hypothetical protein